MPSRHTCSDERRAMDLPPSPPNPESSPRKTLRRSSSHPTDVSKTPPQPCQSQSGSHGYLPSAQCPSPLPLQSLEVGPAIPLRTASSMHEGSASSHKQQQQAPAGFAPGSPRMLKRASRKPEKLTISSGSLFYSHVVAQQQTSPVSQRRQNDDVPSRTGSVHRAVSMPRLSAENDRVINDKGNRSVQVSSGSRFYSDLVLRRNVAPPTPVPGKPGKPTPMTPPRTQEVPASPGARGEVAKGPGHKIEASTPPTQIPHAKATTFDNDAEVRAAVRAAILAQKEADDLEAAAKRAKQVAARAAARVELCAS